MFEEFIKEKCITATNVKFLKTLVLFGIEKNVRTDSVLDLLILLGKWYIYKCKVDKCHPQLSVFKSHLVKRYKIERHNAKLNGTLFSLDLKWFQYNALFIEEPDTIN